MACILLWNSAVRVHDSQVYRKMDVTRERISRILELREILLSFQTGFNLVSAAVVCASPESISGFEPSSVCNWARVLEACDCLKLLSTYFNFCVDATGVVCHRLDLLGTDLHAVEALSRRTTNFASSSSFPAKPSISSRKRRLIISLPPMLIVPSWSS